MGRGGSHVREPSQGVGGAPDEGDTSHRGGEGSLGQAEVWGGRVCSSSS